MVVVIERYLVYYEPVVVQEDPWNCAPEKTNIDVLTILTPLLALFGITGNLVSFVVLKQKELKKSVYVYMAVMAFTGVFSSCILLTSSLAVACDDINWPLFDVYVVLPLGGFFNSLSALTTMLVTLDRCLFLRHPMCRKKPKFCNPKVARRSCAVAALIAAIFNLPHGFIFSPTGEPDRDIGTTPFYYSRFYLVFNWIKFVVLGLAPAILLTLGNGFLISRVRKMRKMKPTCPEFAEKCGKRRAYYASVNTTLILIVIFFLVTQIPFLLTSRGSAGTFFDPSSSEGEEPCEPESLDKVRRVDGLIDALNLAANFLLYYIFCLPFNQILEKVCNCGKSRREKRRQLRKGGCTGQNPVGNVFIVDLGYLEKKGIDCNNNIDEGKGKEVDGCDYSDYGSLESVASK